MEKIELFVLVQGEICICSGLLVTRRLIVWPRDQVLGNTQTIFFKTDSLIKQIFLIHLSAVSYFPGGWFTGFEGSSIYLHWNSNPPLVTEETKGAAVCIEWVAVGVEQSCPTSAVLSLGDCHAHGGPGLIVKSNGLKGQPLSNRGNCSSFWPHASLGDLNARAPLLTSLYLVTTRVDQSVYLTNLERICIFASARPVLTCGMCGLLRCVVWSVVCV